MAAAIPTAADIAEAERIYDDFAGRFEMKHERADYVRQLAVACMQKRRHREWRARFAPEHALVAVATAGRRAA